MPANIRDRVVGNLQPPKIRFQKGDMKTLNIQPTFDAVINMFYAFGFFSDAENAQTMDNFYKSLRKGGQFILHTDVSPEMIESGNYRDIGHIQRKLKPTHIHTLNMTFPAATLNIREDYNQQEKRINGSWEVEELDGTKNREEYNVRIYSAREFRKLCRSAGFRIVRIYGSWDKKPFTGKEQEMIVHATK